MAEFLKLGDTPVIALGPFVDKADGVTPETGLGGSMTVNLSKNGGAFAPRSAVTVSHDDEGWYLVQLDNNDTDTAGSLVVMVSDPATHLPVWKECTVLTSEVWDGLFSTGALPANAKQINSSGTAASNLGNFFTATGYNAANSTVGSVTTVASTTTVGATGQNAIRDAIAAKVVESQGSYTLQQALSIILAAVAGVTDDSGATLKTPNGVATRIAATLAADERTAMTLTPSS